MQKGLYWTHFTDATVVKCDPRVLKMDILKIVRHFYSNPAFRRKLCTPKYLLILAERFRLAHCDTFEGLLKSYEFRNVLSAGYLSSEELHCIFAIESQNPINVSYCLPRLKDINLEPMIIHAMRCTNSTGGNIILEMLYRCWFVGQRAVGEKPNLSLLYDVAFAEHKDLVVWVFAKYRTVK